MDVTALEISPKATEVLKKRGVKSVVCNDFFELEQGDYETILFLMNGIGLIGSIDGFPKFFKTLDRLLLSGGQVLLDSSDLRYLFEDEDGSYRIKKNYYWSEIENSTSNNSSIGLICNIYPNPTNSFLKIETDF